MILPAFVNTAKILSLKRFLSALSWNYKTWVPGIILPLCLTLFESLNFSRPPCSHRYYDSIRQYMTFHFLLSYKIYYSAFLPERNSVQTTRNFDTNIEKIIGTDCQFS